MQTVPTDTYTLKISMIDIADPVSNITDIIGRLQGVTLHAVDQDNPTTITVTFSTRFLSDSAARQIQTELRKNLELKSVRTSPPQLVRKKPLRRGDHLLTG